MAERGGVCFRRHTVRTWCVGIWAHDIWPAPKADAHSFPAILSHCSLLVRWKLEVTHSLIACASALAGFEGWLHAHWVSPFSSPHSHLPGLTAGTSFHSTLIYKPFLPTAWRFVRRWLVTCGKCRCSHQALKWGGPHLKGGKKGICPDFHLGFTCSELQVR